ncbi:hypothetical protein O7623_03625 [Solwaraspora sp. WMMD791]|uniref:hypothetical protein n=1 Tax=Solwaraspora sp. WMMD791 TaxID=3016086 RepID=UPI00249B045E|nr:hypothetical protein [Solwaraspora sp. WMMD791]WFE28312.1 hypothetical protein O7623_03625 [Solwaraspora sp. WMMD791]
MVDTVPASGQDWELANALFLPSDADVAYRQHVAGPDAPKWVTEGDAIVLSYPPPTAAPNLRYKDFNAFAVFGVQGTGLGRPYAIATPYAPVTAWQQDEVEVQKWVVVGLKLDDKFESMPKDSPIRRFESLQLSLNPLISYNPAANDVASRRTFWTNESVLIGVGKWAEHWANEFKRYANELKTDASAWEGSAAGQFAALLREFEKRLREVQREVYPSGATSVPRAIGDGVLAMEKALNDLYRGHVAFYTDPGTWVPRYHVFDALHDHYKGVENAVRLEDNKPVFLNESYDPRSQVMRDAVDKAAKASWLAKVKEILDPVGKEVIGAIRTQYGKSAEVFANAKFDTAPRLVPPTASDSGGGNGKKEIEKLQDDYEKTIDKLVDKYDKIIADLEGDLRNQKDEFEEILKNNNGDNREAMNKMKEDYERIIGDLQDDVGAQKESYDDIIKNLNDDQRANIANLKDDYERVIDGLQGDLTAQKDDYEKLLRGEGVPNQFGIVSPGPVLLPSPQPGAGGDGAARLQYPEGTVLGPDGRPVLDADGAPVVLPPGSRIGPDGTVTGPDGRPVRDGDGAAVLVPPGSSIVTDVPRIPAPQVGRLEPPAGGFDTPVPDLQTAWDLARDPNPMWLVPGDDGGLNLVGPDGTQRSIGGLELVPDGKGGYDLVTDGGTRTPVGGFDLAPGDTDGVRLLPNGDGGVDLVEPDGTRRTIEGLELVPDGKGGYDLVTDGGTRTPVDWLDPDSRVPPPGTIVPPQVVVPSPTPRPDLVGGRDDFGLDTPRPGPSVVVPPAADLVRGGPGAPGAGVSGPGSLVGGVGNTPGQAPAGQTPAQAATAPGAGLGPMAGTAGAAGESSYPPYMPPPGGGGGGGGGQDQPRNRTPYPLREEIDQARSKANRRKSDEPRGWPWETAEPTPESPATADDILDVLAGNPRQPGTTHRPAKDAAEDLPVGDARESGLAALRVPTMEDTIRGEENTWGADSAASGDTAR